jgi:chromosomal replication initiation ATPase DnaA
MKEEVFNQYVQKITKLFGVTKDELFLKSSKRNIVDARQLLYYLCFNRQMQIVIIKDFMRKNGYNIDYPSVVNGIHKVDQKIKEDRDYQSIVKHIDQSVFI